MAVVYVTGVDLDAVEEIIVSRVKQLNDRRCACVSLCPSVRPFVRSSLRWSLTQRDSVKR